MMMTGTDLAKAAALNTVEIGRLIGITSQAISQWKRVPAERVLQIERLTGVSRHQMRPDLYPLPAPAAAHPTLPQSSTAGA